MVEPSRTSAQKPDEDPTEDDPTHNFVTCIHEVKLEEINCQVNVTWAKTLINHTLYITVENPGENLRVQDHYTCKIDLKTWQFWGKKGLKTFQLGTKRFDVFWDLRAAKFGSRPEPDSGYYVAMVAVGDMVLLLGDQRDEAVKRTKSRPCFDDTKLVHKKEIVYANRCFCTKTTLGQSKDYSIMIEAALLGPNDPEMWIFVDGREKVRVPNLHWRFRGNERIKVDGISVDILWDVLGWLYNGNNIGVGIFAFRRCPDEGVSEVGCVEGQECVNSLCDASGETMEFCHFVYACKT